MPWLPFNVVLRHSLFLFFSFLWLIGVPLKYCLQAKSRELNRAFHCWWKSIWLSTFGQQSSVDRSVVEGRLAIITIQLVDRWINHLICSAEQASVGMKFSFVVSREEKEGRRGRGSSLIHKLITSKPNLYGKKRERKKKEDLSSC